MPQARNVVSAATTNSTLVKGARGRVTGYVLTNTAASAKFVKFYNKASAPTVGTDVPVMTVAIPAGAAVEVQLGRGVEFPLGIGFGITGAAAVNDTTAVAAGDVVGSVFWV